MTVTGSAVETPESRSLHTRFLNGCRQTAPKLARAAGTLAGVSTALALCAGGFFPLITSKPIDVAVWDWLAGLGGNALAGWLANWGAQVVGRIVAARTAQTDSLDDELMAQLAAALESALQNDVDLQQDVARFLQRTGAITAALEAIEIQPAEADRLLTALRDDLRRLGLAHGRVGRALQAEMRRAERRLTREIHRVPGRVSERLREDQARAISASHDRAWRVYHDAVRGYADRIPYESLLDLLPAGAPTLSEIYIPLRARPWPSVVSDTTISDPGQIASSPPTPGSEMNLQDMLRRATASTRPPPVIILGPPGAGKSTFLCQIARNSWNAHANLGLPRPYLPLPLRMSALAAAQGVSDSARLLDALA